MPEPTPQRPMSSGEVAEIFGVDITTVGRWADDGKLPHFKTPSGQRRFRREDVDKFLADQESVA